VRTRTSSPSTRRDRWFTHSISSQKMGEWIECYKSKWGHDVPTHSIPPSPDPIADHKSHPLVDYWWRPARGMGSSSWSAMKVAKLMGYEEVILCGVPMEIVPYQNGIPALTFNKHIPKYRQYIESDTHWHDNVYSMSGWTRELLGPPPRLRDELKEGLDNCQS
jgi:hypothetical protein